MALNIRERFKLTRFFSGEKTKQNHFKLTHQRIFILPTLKGLGFVFLILLILLIAFVYNNNLAYLLGFLLASIFFISILHCFKSLSGLIIKQGQCKSSFTGDNVGFKIIIENLTSVDRPSLLAKLDSTIPFSINPQKIKNIVLYTKSQKRGWLNIKTVTLSSTYPFGFFRAWSPLRFSAKALIYPKPANNEFPFPESDNGENKAHLNPSLNKGNEDFQGLKEYQAGDSIRDIHWKAYAKGQGLYTKQYGGGDVTELWLNYDQAPGHDVEERLSQLCRWVVEAEKAGLRYGFQVAGIKLEPNHGSIHYEKCLSALALF